jgi:hypothetical protein
MAGHYFNNAEIQGLAEQYLMIPQENRYRDIEAQALRKKIMTEAGKIVNGIIFKHKFTVWDNYDDLYQEATVACMTALEKFNPNYITTKGERATIFNYFSLTAKRHLKFYTMRNKKNRDNYDLEEYVGVLTHEREIYENPDTLSEEFVLQLKNIFLTLGHKKFITMIDLMDEYLKNIGIFNKRDFFRYCKLSGYSPNQIRKFLRIIRENKLQFSELINT